MDRCEHLEEFLKTEIDVLNKHIPEYMWLRHLTNRTEAELGFVSEYGWLMKELHCGHICAGRETCAIAQRIKLHGDLLKDRV